MPTAPLMSTARDVVPVASVPGLVCVPEIRIAVPVVFSDLITDSEPLLGCAKTTACEVLDPEDPEMEMAPVVLRIDILPDAETPIPPEEVPAIKMFPPPEWILMVVPLDDVPKSTAVEPLDTGPVGKEVPEAPPPM